MDKVTIDRIQLVHPKLRDEVTQIYHEICDALKGKAFCRFAYTLRSFAEQDALYAQGRSIPGKIVTKAKGGQSYHNYGLAIDIVLVADLDGNGSYESASWDTHKDFDGDGQADWMEVVAIFKRYGWEWGGDWKFNDDPHFQKTFGHSVVDLLKMHQLQLVRKNGGYLNL